MVAEKHTQDKKLAPEKKPTCFVIMPISDVPEYEPGHFGRVYEHILKPSIEAAGFEAIRADENKKSDIIVLDIIRKIIESEMVLCDISSKNANVLYELGMRHAFGGNVVITKDKNKCSIFDIDTIRYVEYDHSLRIDTAKKDITAISSAITETHRLGRDDPNSLVKLAMITPAKIPDKSQLSNDTQMILNFIGNLSSKFDDLLLQSKNCPPMPAFQENNREDERSMKFVLSQPKKIHLPNGVYEIGDTIYDKEVNEVGSIVSIEKDGFKVLTKDRGIILISYEMIITNGFSTIPF